MAIDVQKDRQVRNLLCIIDDLVQAEESLKKQLGQIKYFRDYSTPGIVKLKLPVAMSSKETVYRAEILRDTAWLYYNLLDEYIKGSEKYTDLQE